MMMSRIEGIRHTPGVLRKCKKKKCLVIFFSLVSFESFEDSQSMLSLYEEDALYWDELGFGRKMPGPLILDTG